MYKFNFRIFLLLIFLGLFSCQSNTEKFNEKDYIKSVQEWQQQRLENLKSETGWLNLVGLYWLKKGQNPFGSNEANNIIFPEKAPDFIGTIILYKGNLSISVNEDVSVYVNDSLTIEHNINTDMEDNTTIFKMGSFSWHIIKRDDRYGIRLRDLESLLIEQFTEIPYFTVDPNWRIETKFERFDSPKEIAVPNVLGDVEFEKCYGLLKFQIEEKEYSLMPLGDGVNSGLFLIFADETSAEETYGAGRFLSVEKPDKNGKTYIDFNKATNPPCAFTDFATCPLPPRENILPVKILAGEKINEHFGHH
ncbi:MAG: DUF1684 domain-containing protein [Bacteroidales bacterium]|nr:DUF1684 domain-containing protein [Bacteroidales bacterium]MCD4833025.1 DUF1684 domain-containing protein [Bacteroidales bacterium]